MAGTVTVGSKLATALVLQLQEPYVRQENVMGAIKDVTYYRHAGRKVVIKGAAFRAEQGPRGPHFGGYALTHGVDADFATRWMEQNKDSPAVENGMIFISAKPADAEAQAKEFKNERSGLEPLNPSQLPAEFQRKGSKIETAEKT